MTKDDYDIEVAKEYTTLQERIAELEKENAELKEELKDANKKVVHLACNQNKDLKRKINKAKELIKYLLSFIQKENYRTRWDINIEEAEQFLSEVEKNEEVQD